MEVGQINLGALSVSLAVKDLDASRRFYERPAFEPMGGDPVQGWLILKNGDRSAAVSARVNVIITVSPERESRPDH